MRTPVSILVLLLVGAVFALSGCPQSGTETAGKPAAGTPAQPQPTGAWSGDAKDFAYTTFAGATGRASDFAGKPLVVNFWAAW